MARDSSLIRMLKNDSGIMGLNIDNSYKKADLLLNLYRKIDWTLQGRIDDIEETYAYESDSMLETLSCLLEFIPPKEMNVFKAKATAAMKSRTLMDLINTAVVRLREYPCNGVLYHSIIELKYTSYFIFTEEEILEQLDLERSTYYRKKKEATYLIGYILFGFVIPDYVKTEKVANFCD